ncbi:hypothetical protein C0995_015297 [Termitomyces sp. Mi166|nr:hypothetical protein C0995_015297 [Termitomyces sp. Mi166\
MAEEQERQQALAVLEEQQRLRNIVMVQTQERQQQALATLHQERRQEFRLEHVDLNPEDRPLDQARAQGILQGWEQQR